MNYYCNVIISLASQETVFDRMGFNWVQRRLGTQYRDVLLPGLLREPAALWYLSVVAL